MKAKNFLYKYSRILLLVLIFVVFSILSDRFWSPTNWTNVANVIFYQAPFTILLALAMVLPIIFSGLDMGNGSAVAAISCLIGFALRATNNNVAVGIIVGIVGGLIVGVINGFLIGKHIPCSGSSAALQC